MIYLSLLHGKDFLNIEKAIPIPIEKLYDFPNHPFKVVDDKEMEKMAETVKQGGIIIPLIVRQRADGNYEIISGHRRKRASQLANLKEVPCIVRNMSDDEAIIKMVDSNMQREKILPSEKAFAYKMKLEAEKHQGKRTDLTSSQLATKLQEDGTAKKIGKELGESKDTVYRYIRLTELIPELLKLVDEERIAFSPAVEISYLKEDEQYVLHNLIEYNDSTPSQSQAKYLKKLSQEGRKKMTAITRYVTVGLALFESIAMAIGFGRQGMIPNMNFLKGIVVVASLTAGSAMLMWLGERITEKGVGNGISIVLTINIVSRIPSDVSLLYENFVKGKTIAKGMLAACIIAVIILFVVVLVLILNGAERRIPVQYSRKMVGRKMMGGQSTNIPLKVNTAGVIPVIFASSIMSFPSIIAQFAGKGNGTGIGSEILRGLSSNNWCNPSQIQYSWGLIVYVVLCVFFAYFYTSITFNPLEVADNIKKQGGFIPGIRPGKPTSDYLTKILNYIIFIGAVGLVIVAVIPFFFNGVFGANVSFGGTSIIIIVGVILETVKQMESQLLVRNYKGFLN